MIYSLKNEFFTLSFDDKGIITEFVYGNEKNSAESTPAFVLVKNDKTEDFPVKVRLSKNDISVQFACGISILVKTKIYKEFITFTLSEVSSENFHSVKFFNAKVNINYDDTDNPEGISACLIALTLATHMQEHSGKNTFLTATAYTHIGVLGNERSPYKPSCAVTLCKNKDLTHIQRNILDVIPDGELPKSKFGGPYAKNAVQKEKKTYCIQWTVINDENYEEQVKLLKSLGVEQINIHNLTTYYSGSYKVMKDAYPNGIEEFKKIAERLKNDGFELGFHPYVFFINPDDEYIHPVPHDDIAVMREFTLKEDLDCSAEEIFTVERLDGVTPYLAYVYCNSQTLRIDDELVKFKAVDESGKFYNVERGVLGTVKSAHKKGAKIRQYKEFFFHYLAKPSSKLFYEIARNAAEFYNELDFDSVYFDALDGVAVLDGEDYAWYHAIDFIREFFAHIKKDPVFDCCHNLQYTSSWFVRSRFGALDRQIIAHNDYKDAQAHYNKKFTERMGVTQEYGWIELYPESQRSDYYLQLMPQRKENFAYLYGKLMATEGCVAYLEVIPAKQEIPAVKEYIETIKEYSDYRNAYSLSENSKKYLKSDKSECLIDNGILKKASFNVYRFEHEDKTNNFINVFQKQKPFIRIENLYSAKDYESDGIILSNATTLYDGFEKLELFPEKNLSKYLGLGVWIKGDNGGGLAEFTIGSLKGNSNSRGVFYVRNDFCGWKYFAFVEHQQGDEKSIPVIEVSNGTYSELQNFYGYYISPVDYTAVEKFEIKYYGNGNPKLKPIKAVGYESINLINPAITINGEKIVFNCLMKSTDTLECDYDGNVRIIDKKFNVLSKFKLKNELPILKNGDNEATFSCDSKKQTRVRVTIGLLGNALK